MIKNYLRKLIINIFEEEGYENKKECNSVVIPEKDLFTITKISNLKGISQPALLKRIKKENIKPIKIIGRRKYYDINVINKNLDEKPIFIRNGRQDNISASNYYTVKQTSKKLGLSLFYIYQLTKKGKLKSKKMNNLIVFEKKYINSIKGKKLWN